MTSDEQIRDALRRDRTIDIITTGRSSGRDQRIEIWFHNLDDRIFISGLPGRRAWYANLLAEPRFVFHLKETVQADLPALARPIVDAREREAILRPLLERLGRVSDLEAWAARSPLAEVTFPAATA